MDSYISIGKVVLANKPLSNIELVDAVGEERIGWPGSKTKTTSTTSIATEQHFKNTQLQRCIFTRYVA